MISRSLNFCGVACFTALSCSPVAFAGEYKLGPMDKVRVKAMEWRPGKAEYFEWKAVSGDYVVDAAGRITVPLVGRITAQQRTTEDVAEALKEAMRQKIGVGAQPDASVEVVDYRPIYVIGDAARPGEISYRPDMTVLQAMSVAGGSYRAGDLTGLVAMVRDRVSAEGTLTTSQSELQRSLLRRYRLVAELNESPALDFQGEKDDEMMRLISDENAILRSRLKTVRSRRKSIKEEIALYAQQIDALKAKSESLEKQVNLARESRGKILRLKKKGLTTNTQTLTAERLVAELESRLIDIDSTTLQTKQNLSKAQREQLDLEASRQARIVTEIQELDTHLDEVKAKFVTSTNIVSLMERASDQVVQVSQSANQKEQGTTKYVITRQGDDGVPFQFTASETTLVEPGDVIRAIALERSKGSSGGGIETAVNSGSVAVTLPSFVAKLLRISMPSDADGSAK